MSKKSDKHSRDLEKHSAEIKKLRRRLEEADRSAAKWKAKAAKRQKRIKTLRKELSSLRAEPEATPDSASSPTGLAQPDEAWTVTRLRARARELAVPRYSRMTKAELVDALTRPTGL